MYPLMCVFLLCFLTGFSQAQAQDQSQIQSQSQSQSQTQALRHSDAVPPAPQDTALDGTSPSVIGYFQTDFRYQYRIRLLELALAKTADAEPDTKLMALSYPVTQSRGLMLLETGEVQVAFLPTSEALEQRFLPIRIPIMQGLLGYRVLMIHERQRDRFARIDSLATLQREFVAGFGADWTDFAILRHNRLRVEGVTQYQNLFAMLNAGRFDYIPRGINEAWAEVDAMKQRYPNLMVDSNLMLHYDYPIYFFVNRHNWPLASRIERGLKLALNDGSFKQLFLDYHQELIKKANLPSRRFFQLANPTLPANSPAIDTSWWLPKQPALE